MKQYWELFKTRLWPLSWVRAFVWLYLFGVYIDGTPLWIMSIYSEQVTSGQRFGLVVMYMFAVFLDWFIRKGSKALLNALK